MNTNDRNDRIISILQGINRYGNMSKIAEILYLTQPYISRVIKSLEDQYQVSFVNRQAHPLRLTYAGEFYLQKLIEMNRFNRDIEHTMKSFSGQSAGHVTIGINPTLSFIISPIIMRALKFKYPHIQVNLIEIPSKKLEQKLSNQEIDLYIGINNFTVPNLKHDTLYTEGVTVVYPLRLLQDNDTSLQTDHIPELLDQRDFIETTLNSGLQRFSDSYFAKYNIKPNIVMQNVMMQTAFRMACNGIGATLVPNSLETLLPASQEVKFIQLNLNDYSMNIDLAYLGQVSQSESVVKLIEVIQNIDFSKKLKLNR